MRLRMPSDIVPAKRAKAQCARAGSNLNDTKATNDPKGMSKHPRRFAVKAEWDIAQAKFTSQKITPAGS